MSIASLVRAFARLLVCEFARSLVHAFAHVYIFMLACSCIYALAQVYSFVRSPIHTCTFSLPAFAFPLCVHRLIMYAFDSVTKVVIR